MRWVFIFWFALALSLVLMAGCSDENGEGGSGGTAGTGGSSGTGGSGGVIGDCTGAEDFAGCTFGDLEGLCLGGVCHVTDCSAAGDRTSCALFDDIDGFLPGLCVAGVCEAECGVLDDGSACHIGDEPGVCANGHCIMSCENDDDCSDYTDCTSDVCLGNGLCESTAVFDGTSCAGGTCQSGACVLDTTVLPCTDQGVRNAVAAGGGPYTFDCEGPRTIVTRAPIAIEKNVVLNGEGNLTIDGPDSAPPLDRDDGRELSVFYVTAGVAAELQGLGVTDSVFSGIINEGTLTLTNIIISGNERSGLGNDDTGILSATGVTIAANDSLSGDGGGVFNTGILTLSDSIISENRSSGGGGGIMNGAGTATLVNTTISGNTSVGAEGGGISNGGTLTMIGCTISGNTSADGGSISNIGSMTLNNALIDGDCGGTTGLAVPEKTPISAGYNIESPGDTCGFDTNKGDQVNVTAEQLNLGELADNGGPTMTHELLTGSVAIDVVPEVDCVDADGAPLTTDQRGEPRPETGGTMCDVGAFEVQP